MPYRVITISRQYGCGARVIGRQLAERLGIAYYDKDLIRMIADESGYATDYIEEQSDYASTSDLVFIPMSHVAPISVPMTSLIDTPQVASYLNDLIIRLAEEYPCVIIGRSADYILRDRDDVLNVFLYADVPSRVHTLLQRRDEVSEEAAIKSIEQTDRARRKSYKQMTNREWGESTNYHLCLNTGAFGAPCCTEIISHVYQLPCAGRAIE
jgi:Cytidylate kinase